MESGINRGLCFWDARLRLFKLGFEDGSFVQCLPRTIGFHDSVPTAGSGFLLDNAQPEMVIDRKGNCSQGLRSCAQQGLDTAIQSIKQMAAKIRQASELWELERYLTQRGNEIDRKYEYKYPVPLPMFGELDQRTQARRKRLSGTGGRQAGVYPQGGQESGGLNWAVAQAPSFRCVSDSFNI